jgi:hypothetical protein
MPIGEMDRRKVRFWGNYGFAADDVSVEARKPLKCAVKKQA